MLLALAILIFFCCLALLWSARQICRQKDAELNAIFRAFPDILFRLDAGGTIIDYRAGDESELYVPPQVFLRKKLTDVLPPAVGEQGQQAIRQALQTRRIINLEYSLPIKGQENYYEARVVPTKNGQVLIIIRNISQLNELQRELQNKNGR